MENFRYPTIETRQYFLQKSVCTGDQIDLPIWFTNEQNYLSLTALRHDTWKDEESFNKTCIKEKKKRGGTHQLFYGTKKQKQMSSTKVSSVRSKQLLRSGNLSRLTLWWVTADQLLKATSKPSSKSLMYKKETKPNSSPIM